LRAASASSSAPGIYKHAEIRSDVRKVKSKIQKKGATGVAAIIEGKNYELICRNESGHRRGDWFRHVNRGRYGPGLAKPDPNS